MTPAYRPNHSDRAFLAALAILGGTYVALIVAMVVAEALYTSPSHFWRTLRTEAVQQAIVLSMVSCTISAVLSLWVAAPLAYLMSRFEFRGKRVIDAIVDIPIVLPPMVVGLCLLILFQWGPLRAFQEWRWGFRITFAVPSIIIGQFAVACAFAVRTLRVTFDQISPRTEQVALTLGCSRRQAFWLVVLPEARGGLLAAFTLAWARALGEFGPILVFSGTTRGRTEVLSSSVYLYWSIGDLEGAIAVSLLMVAAAVAVMVVTRSLGADAGFGAVRARP